jgi:hypothetical protein
MPMAWFLKYYRHRKCLTHWTDEWSCACNDRCPKCDAEIEAYDWDDLTVTVNKSAGGTGWVVLVSPPQAEHTPDYARTFFARKEDANKFAASQAERLGR